MVPFEPGSPERRLAVTHLLEQLTITSEIIKTAVVGNPGIFPEACQEFDRAFPEMLREATEELVEKSKKQ
jgi:hypothetical protein